MPTTMRRPVEPWGWLGDVKPLSRPWPNGAGRAAPRRRAFPLMSGTQPPSKMPRPHFSYRQVASIWSLPTPESVAATMNVPKALVSLAT